MQKVLTARGQSKNILAFWEGGPNSGGGKGVVKGEDTGRYWGHDVGKKMVGQGDLEKGGCNMRKAL